MSDDYIDTISEAFKKHESRQIFFELLENDYRSYDIHYLRPEQIDIRGLKVVLPLVIFENVSEIFSILLHQIKEDFIMGQTVIEQLLRLMLFAKLFGFNLGTSSIW